MPRHVASASAVDRRCKEDTMVATAETRVIAALKHAQANAALCLFIGCGEGDSR
jgi:hypothetical protein